MTTEKKGVYITVYDIIIITFVHICTQTYIIYTSFHLLLHPLAAGCNLSMTSVKRLSNAFKSDKKQTPIQKALKFKVNMYAYNHINYNICIQSTTNTNTENNNTTLQNRNISQFSGLTK